MLKTIKLSDIKIREDFAETNPNPEKIAKAIKHIEKYNMIDKPIILNNGILVDNYIRYIAAASKGLQEVSFIELQQMSYIVGKHKHCKKEYIWKNDRGLDIKIGDKVIVRNKRKKSSLVEVSYVFTSDNLDLYNEHMSVIKKVTTKVI